MTSENVGGDGMLPFPAQEAKGVPRCHITAKK
jgi:hypothetical protein